MSVLHWKQRNYVLFQWRCKLCVLLLCIGPYMCSDSYWSCDSCIGHRPARFVCWDMRVRIISPVRLNPMGHVVSPVCLDQLSPFTLCNYFCGSGIAGITRQDINTNNILKHISPNNSTRFSETFVSFCSFPVFLATNSSFVQCFYYCL